VLFDAAFELPVRGTTHRDRRGQADEGWQLRAARAAARREVDGRFDVARGAARTCGQLERPIEDRAAHAGDAIQPILKPIDARPF